MAVGASRSGQVFDVEGVRLSAVCSNIRYQGRRDLVLVELAAGAKVAGVFTQNAFCAAPVKVAKDHLEKAASRFFLVNTGNANAGTGEAGILDALKCCQSVADIAGVKITEVLPFSTGVIGEPLPVDKIVVGVPQAFTSLAAESWMDAARGIMTTDTRPKLASARVEIDGKTVTISGMAKGSGMIKPDMATMLAYIFTDAEIDQVLLQELVLQAANKSFNRITVDGDTSTNDSCVLAATGLSGAKLDSKDPNSLEVFTTVLNGVCIDLAIGLIKDAEGASKFATIIINNGGSQSECLQVAYAVAESPLVKTALFASDPNWGRILAVVGRAGLENLDVENVSIFLDQQCIVEGGALAKDYTEAKGQQLMEQEEITITVDLGRGDHAETVWTSDLSHDYIRINAEYRT